MRKPVALKLTLRPCIGCGKPTPAPHKICESCNENEIDVQPTGDRATFLVRW